MTTKLFLPLLASSLLFIACGSDNDSTTNTDRFTTMEMMGDTLRVDTMKKLEWVGSAGMNACSPHAAATTEEADIASAQTHCQALVFGGHDDWRMATASEHQDFITGMNDAGIVPFYANPACPRLIGVDSGSAKAVNTHNSTPIGAMTTWATLLSQDATNFGVKCVRNTQ